MIESISFSNAYMWMQAETPEELMMLSKKGQSVMMFVGIGDVNGKRAEKFYTERWIGIWQNSLFNNHIDVQVNEFSFIFDSLQENLIYRE